MSWQLLNRLSHGCELAWICEGDFNEIFFAHVKKEMRDRNGPQEEIQRGNSEGD